MSGVMSRSHGHYTPPHMIKANSQVPQNIKCNRCNVVKPSSAFSNKQQGDLVQFKNRYRGPSFDATKIAHICCIPCTSQQTTELHCVECNKWKGKDKFAKNQRSTPDNAMCWACREDRQNLEAREESDHDNEVDDDDYETDGSGEDYCMSGGVPTSAMSGMSITAKSLPSSTMGSSSGKTLPSALHSTPGASTVRNTSGTSVTSGRTVSGASTGVQRQVAASGNGNFPRVKAVPRKWEFDTVRQEREQEEAAKKKKKQKAANGEFDDDDKQLIADSDSDEE